MNILKHALITFIFAIFTTNNVSAKIVEWAPFEVKEGVSEKQLVSAAQAVESQFLRSQAGYISRSLLKGKDGKWVDIVQWETEADAQNAAKQAYESPICYSYFSLMKGIEHSDISNVKHFDVVQSWR